MLHTTVSHMEASHTWKDSSHNDDWWVQVSKESVGIRQPIISQLTTRGFHRGNSASQSQAAVTKVICLQKEVVYYLALNNVSCSYYFLLEWQFKHKALKNCFSCSPCLLFIASYSTCLQVMDKYLKGQMHHSGCSMKFKMDKSQCFMLIYF